MLLTLCLIIACYAVAVAAVHVARHWHKKRGLDAKGRELEYVLVTKQNQLQIEWVIRALMMYAGLRGGRLRLTIIDDQSTDLTIPIVKRLTMHRSVDVLIIDASDWDSNAVMQHMRQPIRIRLNEVEDWAKIPFAG